MTESISKTVELSGKRIIVVGGAGLLGTRTVIGLMAQGAELVLADVSSEGLLRASEIVRGTTGRLPKLVTRVDITCPTSLDNMIETAIKALGGLDGVVNTAYPRNPHYGRKFEDVVFEDFCENVSLHLGGYFLLAKQVLRHFKSNGGGNLIQMSSIYGHIPPRFEVYEGTDMTMPVEYAAIKSAVIHLTKYLAKYYAGNNIRVNCISLGGLLNDQPQSFVAAYRRNCLDKGMLDPDDIVGTIAFLLSDASRYINGQNLVVDDGFTL